MPNWVRARSQATAVFRRPEEKGGETRLPHVPTSRILPRHRKANRAPMSVSDLAGTPAQPDVAAQTDPLPRASRRGIGLCLSGGGFRASLFHLGALRRLNELGILAR